MIPPTDSTAPRDNSRLNLLLSNAGWRGESWADQLPQLLDPMGVRSIRVDSGRAAEDVIRTTHVHIAVIDLAIPLDGTETSAAREEAGSRILQLIRRLTPTPPTIVVRNQQPAERERVRGLSEALREGAFSVIDRPVHMETMLEILRRILRRHYADLWPNS